MAKSNGVGGAARAGLLAALLAEQGFVGPERPLEGARGFFAVMSEAVKGEALSENLGATWEIQRNSYKPYPCGVVLNSVIDACLEIKKRKPVDLAQIAEITISAHPLLRERTDRPHVETGRLSQVSAQHAAAVVFVKGAAGLPQFSDEAVHDPAVRRLRAKVLVAEVQAIPVGAAHVEVVFGSGETIAITVEHARGSLERPLSDQELEQKLITLSAFGCPQLKSSLLIDAVWSLDQTTDGSAVLKYAIPLENAELLGRSAGLTDI
jgi:2-methylcitrate dehydratase PrpD